jgi:hypothetical protein
MGWRKGVVGKFYFLHVDAVACATEDQACSHCFCKSAGLLREIC